MASSCWTLSKHPQCSHILHTCLISYAHIATEELHGFGCFWQLFWTQNFFLALMAAASLYLLTHIQLPVVAAQAGFESWNHGWVQPSKQCNTGVVEVIGMFGATKLFATFVRESNYLDLATFWRTPWTSSSSFNTNWSNCFHLLCKHTRLKVSLWQSWRSSFQPLHCMISTATSAI